MKKCKEDPRSYKRNLRLPVRPLAPPPFSQKWRKCRIQVLRSQETVSLL